ncbi:MAG: dihydroorotate dehydrogenase (quinone) [Gammaproteobacteria bacterium RIFCSPHIGHO2_02_FULL_39_13]|nr:MAG: dihydroorotate dehydrogenase (quinone) [Gammaproteobacteria bacterium RIFCSPHIGHO2_02_FULL_39_13]OGT49218.1 MAG: dihydroorotate dehydrogenase (quinone) [Gammaproteobacteria bacterium RIFCSPHIGHO2_12_FULL_39_24]
MSSLIGKLLFQLPPETAHRLAQHFINVRYGLLGNDIKTLQKPIELFGLHFPNPVGLAAGWDKNAECVDALFRMGLGFVEVGTVTPKPQAGNSKPRLFRIAEKQALINRMGFNNVGVDAMVMKLQSRKVPGIVGVNIGKNKDTALNHALTDYQLCLKAVYPYADYVVINISSPNTPGLRELQSTHYLNQLLQGLQRAKKSLAGQYHRDVPLLVKTTVDLPQMDYEGFVRALMDNEIDGVVISNTTLDHTSVANCRYGNEMGGLSGAPLREGTTRMIAAIHQISNKKLPIIGVGGILSGEDALAHWQAGAQLVQVYTGFVYRGPTLVHEILRVLEKMV